MFTWAGIWLCNLAPMHSAPFTLTLTLMGTNPSQYLHLHKDPPGSLGLDKIKFKVVIEWEVK